MLDPKVVALLNRQIAIEAQASHKYLALAVWCDMKGFSGAATFLYEHSDEERLHMLKMVNYVTDQGGNIAFEGLEKPKSDFKTIQELIRFAYEGEIKVTKAIYDIVSLCLELKDHTTHNFIQWYVNEQLEEESLYRTVLDRMELIGDSGNALYLIDVEIGKLSKGASGMASIEKLA